MEWWSNDFRMNDNKENGSCSISGKLFFDLLYDFPFFLC